MIEKISKKVGLDHLGVRATIKLLDEGATIPFIARYRKEVTRNLDEVDITSIRDAYETYKEFNKRKLFIIESIDKQGLMTDELKNEIENAVNLSHLEDIYLPFKPKRNTKAEMARKLGLEPLAKIISEQNNPFIEEAARRFVGREKAATVQDAISGAGFIIAEWISENKNIRQKLRRLFQHKSVLTSKKVKTAEDDKETYKNYYDRVEPVHKASSHKILALFRGEKEGILRIKIQPDKIEALDIIKSYFIHPKSVVRELMEDIVKDSYDRLIASSLENELRAELKLKADKKAIEIFQKNLEQLLMLPPFPGKRILAIDPGFRTGCKVVCLDENGNLLHNQTIYPHPPQREAKQAMRTVSSLVQQFNIEAIAIGNGTAGRETENLIGRIRFHQDLVAMMVNENGASIYSASKIARDEFPDYDITVRGAVSIGRRLSDPLAELVKIDPKSIGVGQYQYDVDQKALKQSLDDVVVSCVNRVGVDLNTASKELLQYISGLGTTLADNIVEYRKKNGNFTSRSQLKKVARLGEKAFEQAAGFIRIRNPKNPLDNTAVHPESYGIVEKMARKNHISMEELIRNEGVLNSINPEDYIGSEFGVLTVKDILDELKKPNRDPRKKAKRFEFSNDVHHIGDLKTGMILPGIITNITGFGAFCDVGVHQDGLIHISQLAEGFVSDPHEIVSLNQYVKVEVIYLEVEKKRINFRLIQKV